MRVIGVIGKKDTGKTSIICDILKHVSGISVATIKKTHHSVEIDTPNTDSYRMKENSNLSVLSTGTKTGFYYDGMSLYEILSKIDYDLVIIEGFKEELIKYNIPKILMVEGKRGLDLLDNQVIMTIEDFKYDIKEVISEITDKAVVPTYNFNCGHCGYNCKQFVEKMIKGENNLKWDRCVMSYSIKITADDKIIPANPFVSDIIKNTIKGLIFSLKSVENPQKITISFDDESNNDLSNKIVVKTIENEKLNSKKN
ncbi:molybdopterin-guanine dinucleotide biosynthesis protein MobB [Methanococcus voltae]|uniref:Molybdopterin-guanine dinucleotide biosynthesis protein MobB region n=1 Tax=Methanococcus voltae (strain ATCC BAA-1334 / A3) TaxID=456320 RepID=D7DQK9_METV3|nr:molybdopterin-guanine dinucleotide biosynthesis protein MobB [Methanococcus voltae]MCS3901628.1 molybdopterin-guanine dinucleotide biosynthesis protein B [Methanococcus voltae]